MGCGKTWGWWWSASDGREKVSSPPLPSPFLQLLYQCVCSRVCPPRAVGGVRGVDPGSGTHLHTAVQAMMEEGRV